MLLFGLIAIAPAVQMFMRSLWVDGHLTFEHYTAVLSSGRHAGLLVRSLGISLTAAFMALLMAVPQAFLLVRSDLAARRFWQRVYLLPLCIPPHVHAIAWIYLCGENGFLNQLLGRLLHSTAPVLDIYNPFWAAFFLALGFHPMITLMTSSGLLSMDQRQEEAARQFHPMGRVLGKVTLPLLLPHILSGAVFVFIFAFFNYGVPALLRVHTYPVEIFAQFSAFYNESAATALAVPVIAVTLVLLAVQRIWMKGRSYVVMDTGRTEPAMLCLGKFRTPAGVFILLLFIGAVALPLITLLAQTRTPATLAVVWRSAGKEIVSTTLWSLTAATVMTALAYLLTGLQSRRRGRLSAGIDILFFAPLALPATVLGIGLIYLWNRPLTQVIYTSAGILVIAYSARFVPFVLQAVLAGRRQVGPRLREAAWLYQGQWWRRVLMIDAPLCLPGLVAGWSIAFILCMGELGTTLLVIPPGMGTLSLKIYTLMHYGASQMVAALSYILICINLAVAACAVWGAGRFGRAALK